jgi:hypothetical protein
MRSPQILLLVPALVAVSPVPACDLGRPLVAPSVAGTLLQTTHALADAGGCRILLGPDLAERPAPALPVGMSISDALDHVAIALDLNWTRDDNGTLHVLAAAEAVPATRSAPLTIAAARVPAPLPAPIEQARLPGERGPATARTSLGDAQFDDDALHDYTTTVARAPGVYGMASSDVIRGIGASRLSPSQRASLLTLDGIPLPAEAWLFNRPGLGLVRGLDVTRSGTGLASAYGAGAGDLAMTTRAPSSETHAHLVATHAPTQAPQGFVSATGGLGVPGLRTAFGVGRQVGTEAITAVAEPDVFHQRQYAARLAWQSPAGAHVLQASAIDFRRADFGGAESPCGGGPPHCVLGADIGIDGAAASWQWQIDEPWRLLVLAGSSDTRAMVLRADLGELQPAQPAFIGMMHAEARFEFAASPDSTISAGLLQARRDYRLHGGRRFIINLGTADSLGMVPAGPGPGRLQYANTETARTDLPQAYAEWAFAGGAHWDGHVGLRVVDAESASRIEARDIVHDNCTIAPGHHPGLDTCAEALVALVQARNARIRHRDDLWLPNATLRWRDAAGQWIALQWRDGFLGSDMNSLALSPDSAFERIRTSEFAWQRPLGSALQLEWRVFHHDWRDRVANLIGPLPDALRFDSEIFGSEWQIGGRPHARGEWWLQASAMQTRSNLRVLARDDAAVRGAPSWSAGLGGRWRFRNGGYVGGHFGHAEPTWIVNDNASMERLPARDLLDLRVGFRHERYDLSLWGTNLLDDDYVADAYGQSLLLTPYHAYDRVVGVDLRADF